MSEIFFHEKNFMLWKQIHFGNVLHEIIRHILLNKWSIFRGREIWKYILWYIIKGNSLSKSRLRGIFQNNGSLKCAQYCILYSSVENPITEALYPDRYPDEKRGAVQKSYKYKQPYMRARPSLDAAYSVSLLISI